MCLSHEKIVTQSLSNNFDCLGMMIVKREYFYLEALK